MLGIKSQSYPIGTISNSCTYIYLKIIMNNLKILVENQFKYALSSQSIRIVAVARY